MITSIMAAVIYKLVTAAITLIGSYSLQTTLQPWQKRPDFQQYDFITINWLEKKNHKHDYIKSKYVSFFLKGPQTWSPNTNTHKHRHIYKHIHTITHLHTYIKRHTHIYIHTYLQKYTHIHMHHAIHKYTQKHICAYMHTHSNICIQHIYIHIHMYLFI